MKSVFFNFFFNIFIFIFVIFLVLDKLFFVQFFDCWFLLSDCDDVGRCTWLYFTWSFWFYNFFFFVFTFIINWVFHGSFLLRLFHNFSCWDWGFCWNLIFRHWFLLHNLFFWLVFILFTIIFWDRFVFTEVNLLFYNWFCCWILCRLLIWNFDWLINFLCFLIRFYFFLIFILTLIINLSIRYWNCSSLRVWSILCYSFNHIIVGLFSNVSCNVAQVFLLFFDFLVLDLLSLSENIFKVSKRSVLFSILLVDFCELCFSFFKVD